MMSSFGSFTVKNVILLVSATTYFQFPDDEVTWFLVTRLKCTVASSYTTSHSLSQWDKAGRCFFLHLPGQSKYLVWIKLTSWSVFKMDTIILSALISKLGYFAPQAMYSTRFMGSTCQKCIITGSYVTFIITVRHSIVVYEIFYTQGVSIPNGFT